MSNEEFISINKVAEAKGLKSNRSLRLEINKPESKYIAREVKVNDGTSYEILYSSLEPEIQRIFGRVESSEASEPVRCRSDVTPPTPRIIQDENLKENSTKSTALVPLNYQPTTFVSEWVLKREGMKAYHDKVEPYIERDISKIEVGDIIIADGHVLNFQVINPFTGKPTRATLVGFLDWKSTALVGYEIMMTENTQCIASALRNSILNLGVIPKVVYQDNGRAFKSKYFQHCDFDEDGFNGVYANLNIHSVFAKPYNARAKVIERFFREFQEEFEKMMPSYIGTSIEDKPAWMKRGEKLHLKLHENETNNHIPTVQEVIKYINCWLKFYNKKPCPNDRSKSIQEMLNGVQKQHININILNTLMMKTECRTINKHGITFLNIHYRSEAILGLREQVFIRYSLFDLSKIFVYSAKGEFICVAKRVQKVHPMANVLGTVKDMEEYKQQYRKQQQIKNRLVKQIKKNFTSEELQVLEIEQEQPIEIEPIIEEKPKRERVKTPREQQMNRPIFTSNYEKYEWLMKNGCTNSEDRTWLTQYIRSDEYQNIYGD